MSERHVIEVTLSGEIHERVQEYATRENLSLDTVVGRLIALGLRKDEKTRHETAAPRETAVAFPKPVKKAKRSFR